MPGATSSWRAAAIDVGEVAVGLARRCLVHRDEPVERRDDVDLVAGDRAGFVDRREHEDAEHVVAVRFEAGPGLVVVAGGARSRAATVECNVAGMAASIAAGSGSVRSIHRSCPGTASRYGCTGTTTRTTRSG